MSINLKWPNKGITEVLDYAVDWSKRLTTGETITTSTFTVASGSIVIDEQYTVGGVSVVWLSGGSHLVSNILTCDIVTSEAREFNVAILIQTLDRSTG